MPNSYTIKDQFGLYFVTFTVHQWVDVFTRNDYKDILINSLKHCQIEKGLLIYEWVIMTNHIHLIVRSEGEKLSDIIRDFKKYTSRKIIDAIEVNPYESRKNWMLWLLKNEDQRIFWQENYHGEEIVTHKFFVSKQRYIHLNPVRAGIVIREEDYLYGSCRTRFGLDGGLLVLTDY